MVWIPGHLLALFLPILIVDQERNVPDCSRFPRVIRLPPHARCQHDESNPSLPPPDSPERYLRGCLVFVVHDELGVSELMVEARGRVSTMMLRIANAVQSAILTIFRVEAPANLPLACSRVSH